MDSFLQINDLRRDLGERFFEHQSALLHFDLRKPVSGVGCRAPGKTR